MSDQATNRPREPPLILASASPRRIEILAAFGVRFRTVPARIDERPPRPLTPLRLAQWAAGAKVAAVARRFPDATVVGADTVVALDGRAYGKPVDEAGAAAMLRTLSGRTHVVYTAVAVRCGRGRRKTDGYSRTYVTMRDLSPRVIATYLQTGEAQDKAGAYAIQGEGRRLVRSIRGPYDNVVGMPMHLVERLLQACGMTVWVINADGAQHDPDTRRPRAARQGWGRPDPPLAERDRSRGVRRRKQLAAGDHPEHRRHQRS
ncbi:MAG: Maf family protein [Candidatus Dormibacter sp.]